MSISEGSGPELTKKQELNNHKVSMRKWVRQAKVHAVHKLSREAKKLRERKGDEKTKQKCERKAERLSKEILSIKDLDIDEVAIKALLNTKTLDEVLNNINATSEERAYARLIHHQSVQAQVKIYRDNNPHWKLQIPVLLERSKEKEKKAQKKKIEKLQKKQRKPITPAGVVEDGADETLKEKLIENPDEGTTENLEVTSSAKIDSSVSSADETENLEESEPESESEESEAEEASAESGSEAEEKEQVPTPIKPTPVKQESLKKPVISKIETKPSTHLSQLDKLQGTIKVQVITDWSDFEKSEPVVTTEAAEETSDAVPVQEKKKPRSSFFVGGVEEVKEEPEHQEKPPAPRFGIIKSRKAGPVRPWKINAESHEEDSRPAPNKSRQQRYFDNTPAKTFDGPKKFSERKPDRSTNVPPRGRADKPAEKLHPSWEAKKRQNISTASFQGKKIKFDD